MISNQTAPEGFNNPDWRLFPGNKNHVHFLPKCIELFWLIWECQQLTGEAFFGQEWLAKRLGITVRHVQNLIAELKSYNLIEVERRDQNYYKIVEMFSQPPSYWTEVAKEKAKAALAKFFPSLAKQKANTQQQASRPRKESTFKAAKAQTAQKAPGQTSASQQASSREAIEELQQMTARYEAELKAEQELDPSLQAQVKEVADQLAKANYNKPKPSAKDFIEWLTTKLKSYGVEAPAFLVKKQALVSLQEYNYLFR